jgi:cell division protein FtsN
MDEAGIEIQRPIEEGSFGADEPPRSRRGLLVAGGVAVAAVAVWFGVQMLSSGGEQPPPASDAPSAPAQSRPEQVPLVAEPPAQAAPAQPPPAPPPAQGIAPPASAEPSGAQPAPAPAPVPGTAPPVLQETGPFEIVVASFRTVSRAVSVADELSALGQRARVRESNGWLQILAGPYPSRAAAEEAQKTLDGAGFSGTQIVPAPR